MNIKKMTHLLLALLVFPLIITACGADERPMPKSTNPSQQNAPNTNNSNINNDTDSNSPTDTRLPRVEQDAQVNDKSTRDNMMPSRPEPTTPTSDAGFTLDHINKFNLNVNLTNNNKVDMKYVKGISKNNESRIETVFNGKTETVENQEANRQIETIISQIPGSSLADTSQIVEAVLSALETDRGDVIDFDMEFVFESGEKVHVELNKEVD